MVWFLFFVSLITLTVSGGSQGLSPEPFLMFPQCPKQHVHMNISGLMRDTAGLWFVLTLLQPHTH